MVWRGVPASSSVCGGLAHQCLHVIHGAQVVPDDLGWDLPTDVLAELVSDTDHVEVPVHTCRRKGVGLWGRGRPAGRVEKRGRGQRRERGQSCKGVL